MARPPGRAALDSPLKPRSRCRPKLEPCRRMRDGGCATLGGSIASGLGSRDVAKAAAVAAARGNAGRRRSRGGRRHKLATTRNVWSPPRERRAAAERRAAGVPRGRSGRGARRRRAAGRSEEPRPGARSKDVPEPRRPPKRRGQGRAMRGRAAFDRAPAKLVGEDRRAGGPPEDRRGRASEVPEGLRGNELASAGPSDYGGDTRWHFPLPAGWGPAGERPRLAESSRPTFGVRDHSRGASRIVAEGHTWLTPFKKASTPQTYRLRSLASTSNSI